MWHVACGRHSWMMARFPPSRQRKTMVLETAFFFIFFLSGVPALGNGNSRVPCHRGIPFPFPFLMYSVAELEISTCCRSRVRRP